MKASEQRTPLEGESISQAIPRVSGYKYNFAGALEEETYPSGRVVKNSFETDGDLQKVESKKGGASVFGLYASEMAYTAAGGISQMKLGNNRWETAKVNNRLQVEELGLGSSATDAGDWKVKYEYGEIDASGNLAETKNTGNIARQTISFNGLAAPFVQTYKYDALNRLKEARETSGVGGAQTWQQNFDYDRYSNRTSFSQNIGGAVKNYTPSTILASNRFSNGQGFAYDKNGNVSSDVDPATSQVRQFVFDGENKQIEVKENGVAIGKYYYDGEGKRVKKVTKLETTVFVYSNGELIAEYSTAAPPSNPTTSYTATDQLGSPRVITNSAGEVVSRRDFMPFGEEIYPDTVYRKSTYDKDVYAASIIITSVKKPVIFDTKISRIKEVVFFYLKNLRL